MPTITLLLLQDYHLLFSCFDNVMMNPIQFIWWYIKTTMNPKWNHWVPQQVILLSYTGFCLYKILFISPLLLLVHLSFFLDYPLWRFTLRKWLLTTFPTRSRNTSSFSLENKAVSHLLIPSPWRWTFTKLQDVTLECFSGKDFTYYSIHVRHFRQHLSGTARLLKEIWLWRK